MAKVEFFEKIGEVTIAELRPASMNRSIARAEQERQAEAERIRKEEAERKRQAKAVEVLSNLVEAINECAEAGGEHLELLWTTDLMVGNPHGISSADWKEVGDILSEILGSYGYEVHEPHWYTPSWVTRSGKVGYVNIYWHKS